MRVRRLGVRELEVGELGLGCMNMAALEDPADVAEATATIRAGLDSGVTLFDTGDFYGGGAAEQVLGAALAGRRDAAVVSTKTGLRTGPGGIRHDGSPEYLRSACEASLRRLNVDHIDLYTLARVDPAVPIEESVGAMAELVRAGKVRYLGLSEVSAATLRRAHAVHPISAVQSEYSLWERHVEREVLPACQELGVGFVAYSALGRGFLTGTLRSADDLAPTDYRRHYPRFQGDRFTHNRSLVDAVAPVAAELDVSLAQLALAWLLARPWGVVPLFGARRRSHLVENLAAATVTLSPEDVDRIDRLFPVGAAAGDRYPGPAMASLDGG